MALPPGFVLDKPSQSRPVNLPPGFVLDTELPVAQKPEQQSALRQVADVPVGVIKGVVQGVRMIADAFGANSGTSNSIRSVENYLAGLMSAQAKNDQQEIARIMKEAEDKGIADQVAAGLKAFTVAPVDTLSSALGTAAPAIVAALGAKFLGAGALATTAIGALTGAGMGAGVVKGTIYDETKKALLEAGASEQEAERKAILAQEYGGKNLDQILLGTGLGAAAAVGPLEKGAAALLARRISTNVAAREAAEAAPQAAAKGALRRRAEAGLLEAVPEAVQAGQEQVAANIALQREGFDVPTTRGAFSAATLEGLAGLGLGATIGGGRAAEPTPPAPAPAPAAPPPPQGVQDVAGTEPPTTGGGFEISEVPITGEPAAGAGTTPPAGVAGTGENAGRPTGGESAQSAALKKEIAALEEDNAKRKAGIQEDIAKKAAPKRIENRQRKYAEVEAEIEAKKKQLAALPPTPTAPPAPAFSPEELAQIEAEMEAESAATRAAAPPSEFEAAIAEAQAERAAAPPPPAPPTPPVAPPIPPAAPPARSTVQDDLDELDSLLGGQELRSTGTPRRTQAQIDLDNKIDRMAQRYGLTRKENETSRELGQRIKDAAALAKELETAPLSQAPAKLVAEQEVKPSKPYYPPQEQRDLYEETAEDFNSRVEDEDSKLPKYRELDDEARRIYFQNYINRNSQDEHDRAARALSRFLEGRREESRSKSYLTTDQVGETRARDSYERERGAFGDKASFAYTFPRWSDLSEESQRLFASINKNDTVLEQDMAFRSVKAQVRKEKAEEQSREAAVAAETEATARGERELERALKKQPAGKGEKLSQRVVDALLRGDAATALKYLSEEGQGLKARTYRGAGLRGIGKYYGALQIRVRDSVAREVFRNVARVLADIPGFKVNFVVDENMAADSFGEYDAKTNTVYVSPDGMDEATLLHELVHAATVQIVHQYFTNKSALTPRAVAAVEHIQNIAASARKRLTKDFPNAFENLYEFVAYAMTDADFQYELSRIQVPSLTKATAAAKETYTQEEITGREAGQLVPPSMKSLWDYFTDTLAWLYKIFDPKSKTQKVLVPTESTAVTRATQKEAARRRETASFVKSRKKKLRESGDYEGVSDEDLARIAEEQLAAEEKAAEEELTRRDRTKAEDEEKFEQVVTIKGLFEPIPEDSVARIPREREDLYTQNGLTNLRKTINVEPGYKGNLLLETAAAFQDILAAPEAGIEELAGKGTIGPRLQAKAQPTPKQAGAPSQKTDEEFMQELVGEEGKLRLKPRGARAFLQNLFKGTAYEEIVRKFQNERRVVKRIFDRAQRLEIVKYGGPNINDVQGQLTRSTGMAVNIYETNVRPLADEVHSAVEAYAKKLDITVSEALSHIHAILQARHEPERRAVKFLLNVPLDNQKKYKIKGFVDKDGKPLEKSPDEWRRYVLEELSRPDLAPTEKARKAKAKEFRKLLDQMVSNPAMRGLVKVSQTDPVLRQKQIDAIFNKDSELYSVIASRTSQDIARMRKLFDKKEHKDEIDRVVKSVKDLQDKTAELNKQSNYWSAPVQNIVDFYGYDNYVPFKGRPGATQLDDETDLGAKRIGGELQDMQDSFEGRKSESENPLLQSLSESASAAMRLGRKDLTLAIKNAIKDKILKGKPPTEKNKISFADRYLRGETKKELGGPNKIFHYNEDGTIDILELTDKREVDAIRRGYRVSSPMIDKLNAATSFVGQTHTRYNPAFAPMNFVRDSLTNAWLLGAEFGPAMAGKLISAVSAQVANGGPYRAMQFSRLYSAGKFGEINRLAGGNAPYDSLTEEQKYYRDLSDYVKLGGKVSYLQGVAAKGALDTLVKDIGRNQIIKTKEQADRFFDIYNEMFELAARTAVFRVMRGQFLAEGNSAEDAQVRAVAYAKEVANFEQVGQYGKIAGALFMFFRPAATGAVRAIDALRPAFGFDEESFVMEETANGRTPEQIKKAVAKMRIERDNALRMSAMLLGSGMLMYWMAYMMAGDDEEQRNRIATDDMARWTRYARFFIPGMEQPIQIPWGFGPGAFAAAGAQMAALIGSEGRVSMGDAFSNMALIGLDSFLPLPFSRISPIDNFPAFAIDSALPSIARPFVEYVMNLDGLGREIYNNRQSRYGDAYTGGDNIPEMYKDAARWMFNNIGLGEIDVSPNVMYFFANNYFDGFAKFLSTGRNLWLTLSGDKEFDLKQDSLLAASFVGTKSNVDAREFSKAENQIKEIAKRLNALESTSPERYAEYIAKNPENYALVEYYNSQVNGTLRDLRAMANMIRASSDLTPKERKVQIDMIVNLQNMVKRQILLGAESISGRKL